jgi:hypothetical protein
MFATKRYLSILLATLASATAGSVSAQTTDYTKLVTPADVAKVTGSKGVMVVPMGAPNANMLEMLMFMAQGKQTLMVSFAKPNTFVMDKTNAVAGVPDEAFASADKSILCFRKGNRPVMVQSLISGGKPLLSQDQLRALAKVIYSRM